MTIGFDEIQKRFIEFFHQFDENDRDSVIEWISFYAEFYKNKEIEFVGNYFH